MELIPKIKQALLKNSIGRYDLFAVYKDAIMTLVAQKQAIVKKILALV